MQIIIMTTAMIITAIITTITIRINVVMMMVLGVADGQE